MDVMLRTSYIRLTTIFQKQFCLTIKWENLTNLPNQKVKFGANLLQSTPSSSSHSSENKGRYGAHSPLFAALRVSVLVRF